MTTPYTVDELKIWKNNKLINPKTGKKIKKDGPTYKKIENEFNNNNDLSDGGILSVLNKLLMCDDNRDPISMNLFWTEKDNEKSIIYPLDQLENLVFYTDKNNKIRCFEKESINYMKKFNILTHPITMDELPIQLFESIEIINQENNKISVDDLALNVFQIFTKKSIFIDFKLFIELNMQKLLTFNNEIRDIWIQNLSIQQRNIISSKPLFTKVNSELADYNCNELQRYLLNDIKIALECTKEELSFMIHYIIVGALGIVIQQIKDIYSDVSFAFN